MCGAPSLVSRFLKLKEVDPSLPSLFLSLWTLMYLLLSGLIVVACLKLASIWWIFNSLEQTGCIQLSETAAAGGKGRKHSALPNCAVFCSLGAKTYGGHCTLVLLWPDSSPGLPVRLHSSSRPNPLVWGNEQICSLTSKNQFSNPQAGGLLLNSLLWLWGWGCVLFQRTLALSSKRRVPCIWKGFEFHNRAAGG